MKNKIHYEDNLFFLTLQLKNLRESLHLSMDADFFLDKVAEDLNFIDATLGRIYSTLKENTSLIKRAEYLHTLSKVKTTYSDMLNDIRSGKFAFSAEMEGHFAKLAERQAVHDRDVVEIRKLLRELTKETEDKEDVITNQELEILLKPDEPEEEL